MNIKVIWDANRRFILQILGGLAVFLVLLSVAQSFADVTDDAQALAGRAGKVEEQLRKLDAVYFPAKKERSVLADRHKALVDSLGLSAHVGVEITPDEEKYTTHFHEQKETVFSSFADKANRAGIEHPPQREVSFDERGDLSPEEWRDRYLQLEVLRRVLDAAFEQKVRKIVSVNPGPIEAENIADVADVVLLRYPVTVEMRASFTVMIGMFEAFQKSRSFLSLEIIAIKPAEEDPANLLAVTVQFVGIDLGPPRDAKPGRAGGWGGRTRR